MKAEQRKQELLADSGTPRTRQCTHGQDCCRLPAKQHRLPINCRQVPANCRLTATAVDEVQHMAKCVREVNTEGKSRDIRGSR